MASIELDIPKGAEMTQKPLTKRQKDVLQGFRSLQGKATTKELAIQLRLNVNGLSQTLGALSVHGYVKQVGKNRGGNTQWELLPDPSQLPQQAEASPSDAPPPAA